MENILILSDQYKGDLDTRLLGGKACNLFQLARRGYAVPTFFTLTTTCFQAWFHSAVKLESKPYPNALDVRTLTNQHHTELQQHRLPAELEKQVLIEFDTKFPKNQLVSVRSSAVDEDSKHDSFAGQLDSYLFVTRAQLAKQIGRCFLSAISERAVTYRLARGLALNRIACAVVVQEMVDAEKSGVIFTANPTSNNFDELVLTAGYGLGEGIVSEKVASDTYYADKHSGNLSSKRISTKSVQVLLDKTTGSGTKQCHVEDHKQNQDILNQATIRNLTKIAVSIESYYQFPQDIEWSMARDGVVRILQSRPISTMEPGERWVLDNTNIKENYPGVISPFTFSYTRWIYRVAIRRTILDFGASKKRIKENQKLFSNFVCLIKGHIYYNMTNWYRIYGLLPGFEDYLPVFERTFSLQQDADLTKRGLASLTNISQKVHKYFVYLKILENYLFFDRKANRFHQTFFQVQAYYQEQDVTQLSTNKLIELLEYVTEKTLAHSGITLINDFFTFVNFYNLENSLGKLDLEHPNDVLNHLLLHEQNMESVAPVESVMHLADLVRHDTRLSALFVNIGKPAGIFNELKDNTKYEAFFTKVSEHLSLYGDRSAEELKLESPTIKSNPEILIRHIKSYLNTGINYEKLTKENQQTRLSAEKLVRNKQGFLKRILFKWSLKGARKGVRERENFRFSRTRLFGMARTITREIGGQFVKNKVISSVEDIFFLELDEIKDFVRSGNCYHDFKHLVDTRRALYENEYKNLNLSERLSGFGPLGLTTFSDEAVQDICDERVLKGLGCARGKVRGSALVVTDPNQATDIEGKILVAGMTDPGWVFLMIAAKGLVVENGNILSHTAIIGRELGIPTVVSVKGALSRIKNGQYIEIDGATGTVSLL